MDGHFQITLISPDRMEKCYTHNGLTPSRSIVATCYAMDRSGEAVALGGKASSGTHTKIAKLWITRLPSAFGQSFRAVGLLEPVVQDRAGACVVALAPPMRAEARFSAPVCPSR
jgi:hypothetical protein